MKTNSSTDRPGRETDQEAWAFDILSRHLTESGHSIVNVRRPDQLNRSTRDVDFLIEFDGHDVAVEVTRLDQERHWWVLLDRLQRAILAELGDWPPTSRGLVLELKLLRTGSYAEIDRASVDIVTLARDWGQTPTPRAMKSRLASDLVEVELSPRKSRGLMVLRQTAAHDPWLNPRAAEFVRKLIESKGGQGLSYPELWLLVIDTEVIIGLDLVEEAFAEAAADVPSNWKRLYFLPATDRSDVQCLYLGT